MKEITFALITALLWGVVPLLEKTGLQGTPPLVALFFRSSGVILGFILLGFFFLDPAEIKAVSPRSIMFLVAGGFIASFIAQIFFYHGLKTGEVSKVVPISGSYPLITFILGALIFKEPVSVIKVLGVLLIIAGIWTIKIG